MRAAGLQAVFQALGLTNTTDGYTLNLNVDYLPEESTTSTWITLMPRTDFKHWTAMFVRWHRLLFTSQERSIWHRQARSDYGHIKVDFTFTCHVLPVSNWLPHNQNSRAFPYRGAFHCMVELVTSSIIEITTAGSTGIITNSSD
jgi:hypothetical protein